MTTLDDPRLWVPASPHIGPDEDDLVLLQPTGDPAQDIGGAALAVHRVGAAACEQVMREPVPDEYRLVEALASTRAAFADPFIDGISKSVGGEHYAGLLARDLFDAAEISAVNVYRVCVSKGVAPPLAIQRAGLVYGVPVESLSKYLTVAAEPKSHPVAITDAADRAVLGWAAAVAKEESAPVKVDKAARRTAWEDEPRNAQGEWVRTAQPLPGGLTQEEVVARMLSPVEDPGTTADLRRRGVAGGQRAPDVAGVPTERETRQVRRTRQTRRVRQVRDVQQQSERVKSNRVKAQLTQAVSAKLHPKMQAYLEENRKPADPGLANDLMSRFPEKGGPYENYPSLGYPSSGWVTSASNADATYQMATEADGAVRLRIGHLLDDHTGYGAPERIGSPQHMANMAGQVFEDMPDGIPVETHRISVYDLDKERVESKFDDVLKYARGKGLTAAVADNALEASVSTVAQGYQSEDWYVIGPPPMTPYDHKVIPEIAEFRIAGLPGESIAAVPDDRTGEPSEELDPNQVYRIDAPVRVWNPRAYFDRNQGEHYGAFVNIYLLKPDSGPDVKKAARKTDFWEDEPRNALGEWTETPEQKLRRIAPSLYAQVPGAPPGREVRRIRQTRRARTVRQTAQLQPTHERVKSELLRHQPLRADQMRSFARAQQAVEEKRSHDVPPELLDVDAYQVLSPGQWDKLLTKAGWPYVGEFPDELELRTGPAKESVFGRDILNWNQADQALRASVGSIVEKQRGQKLLTDKKTGKARMWTLGAHDDVGWEELYEDLWQAMEDDPNIAHMQLVYNKLNEDEDVIGVLVNAAPVDPHVIIYSGDGVTDPDQPMKLTLIRSWRQEALHVAQDDHKDIDYDSRDLKIIDTMANANLMVYRLDRADVKMYRAD